MFFFLVNKYKTTEIMNAPCESINITSFVTSVFTAKEPSHLVFFNLLYCIASAISEKNTSNIIIKCIEKHISQV